MAVEQFAIGSYGQSIRCTITDGGSAVDISAGTSLMIHFRTPDGQVISKSASLISGGTTGIMGYTVESGLFDPANRRLLGTWQYQPSLVLGAWSGTTNDKASFRLVDRLQKP